MGTLIFAIALALVLGFAAHRCQNDTFITDTWSRPVSIGKAQ
jgi:hypothetical protein